jgi:hypothetical protein
MMMINDVHEILTGECKYRNKNKFVYILYIQINWNERGREFN